MWFCNDLIYLLRSILFCEVNGQAFLFGEVNSLTAKSVPAGAKLVLFGRYIVNFYVRIEK